MLGSFSREKGKGLSQAAQRWGPQEYGLQPSFHIGYRVGTVRGPGCDLSREHSVPSSIVHTEPRVGLA